MLFLIASVLVKSLDWLHPSPAKDNCEHKWSYQDLTTLSLTDYVIAADGKLLGS